MKPQELRAWILSELRGYLASRRKRDPGKVIQVALLKRLVDQWEENPWLPVPLAMLTAIAESIRPSDDARTAFDLKIMQSQINRALRENLAPHGLLARIVTPSGLRGTRLLDVSLRARLVAVRVPVWARYEWFANADHPFSRIANALLEVPTTDLTLPVEEQAAVSSQQAEPDGMSIEKVAPIQAEPPPAVPDGHFIDIEAERLTPAQAFWFAIRRTLKRNPVMVLAPAALGLVLIFLFLNSFRSPAGASIRDFQPASAGFAENLLTVRNSAGQVLWQRNLIELFNSKILPADGLEPLPASFHFPTPVQAKADTRQNWNQPIVATLDRGQTPRILMLADANIDDRVRQRVNDRLLIWDARGNLLLSRRLGVSFTFDQTYDALDFKSRYLFVEDLDGSGAKEIITSISSDRDTPEIVTIERPTGEILQRYFHFGGINDIRFADINGDGVKEVLLCGLNNDPVTSIRDPRFPGVKDSAYPYKGAFLAAFSYRAFTAGASKQEKFSASLGGLRLPTEVESFYIRLPRTDLARAANAFNFCDRLADTAPDYKPEVLEEGNLANLANFGSVTYRLDRLLSLLAVTTDDPLQTYITIQRRSDPRVRTWDEMKPALKPIYLTPAGTWSFQPTRLH